MLQTDIPDDFVLATGITTSVRTFVELCFKEININIKWKGVRNTINEVEVDSNDEGRVLVRIDSKYFRPSEVDLLIGGYSKSKEILNWEPKTTLQEMIQEMIQHDINST